jgi:tRNA pseudouridine55 synthase
VPPSGILNLHKPSGITSRRGVDGIQRVSRCRRVGHAGTLDPLASGVLVICVGQATRLIEYIQQMPKRYAGTFLLGRSSPTEDIEGEVTPLSNPPIPSWDQLRAAAARWTGPILQRPPIFSALNVAGQRAYDLARRGVPVELQPRPVTIYRLEVVGYDYPEFRVEIECSSGTYVRSLGRDLAESLGTAAVMSALVRTAIGRFTLAEAVRPEQLSPENWTDYLLPPRRAVEGLPMIELSAEQAASIRLGQKIPYAPLPCGETVVAVDTAGRLVALLEAKGPDRLGPTRVFHDDR